MNTKEIINFYRADLEEYELEKNNGFLYWYKNIKKEGYHQNMSINELQYLINNIVLWYELKYPDRAFDLERGINDLRFMDVKKVLNMDIPAFLYRLPSKLVDLMNASYRSSGEGYVPLFEKGKVLLFANKDKRPLILPTPNPLPKINLPYKYFNIFIKLYPKISYEIKEYNYKNDDNSSQKIFSINGNFQIN